MAVDTNRFIVELNFNDGGGWIDISRWTRLKELTRTRHIYNQLKPTIDSCSFKIQYNKDLINKLLYNENDINARVKKVEYFKPDSGINPFRYTPSDDEYDNEVIADYFTGFVEKNYKMQSATRVEWIEVKLIDNNYILDNVISSSFSYVELYLFNSHIPNKSIIHKILNAAGVSNSMISSGVAAFGNKALVIDHFKHLQKQPADSANDALKSLPYGGTYQEIITNLLFQYGYIYYFDTSGKFNLFDFNIRDVMETGTGPFFDEFNNNNITGTLKFNKKPPRYESAEITWSKRVRYDDLGVWADTSGAQGLDSNYPYAYIEVPPGEYYPETASASFTPETYYDFELKDGSTAEDLISVDDVTLYDDYVIETETQYWEPHYKWHPATISQTFEYDWEVTDTSRKCKDAIFGSIGSLITSWITDSKYQETEATGICCLAKLFGLCIAPGIEWKTTTYAYQIVDTIENWTVPSGETMVQNDDGDYGYWEGAYVTGTPLSEDGESLVEKTFNVKPLSFDFKIKNNSDDTIIVSRLEVTGDVIVKGPTQITIDQRSGPTEKIFQYKAPYILQNDHAQSLANAIYDYYYFSTFEYELESPTEYEPGTWVVLTDHNFKSVDGYPLANKFCLIVSRKDVEFTQKHVYKLEEYRSIGLQVTKIYDTHKPIIHAKGGGNALYLDVEYQYENYATSGGMVLSGHVPVGSFSENWPYSATGGMKMRSGASYIEADNKYVYQPLGRAKSSGSSEEEVVLFYFYEPEGEAQTTGVADVYIELEYSPSGSATTSGEAQTERITYLFQTVWQVDAGDTITLPLQMASKNAITGQSEIHEYDFVVDWGDGTEPKRVTWYDSPYKKHTYDHAGTYTVNIYGLIEGFGWDYWLQENSSTKLVDILDFGVGFRFHNRGGQLSNTTSLTNISSTYAPVLSNVDRMDNMFYGSAFNGDLSGWDFSSVIDMKNMFESSSFNQPMIGWNTSNVVDMSRMFFDSDFNNTIDIDTSSLERMDYMFAYCDFNSSLSSFDTSNVVSMRYVFWYSKYFDQDISSWDTSSVEDMTGMFYAGLNKGVFNQDISSWDVSNVKDMGYMFYGSKFNQDISEWNVSSVEDMGYMFAWSKFNQDISGWDTSSVKAMNGMFYGCDFNQDLYGLDISGLDETRINNTLFNIFTSSDMSVDNYSRFLDWCAETNRYNLFIQCSDKYHNNPATVTLLKARGWSVKDKGAI
jgi:hypothetical protein